MIYEHTPPNEVAFRLLPIEINREIALYLDDHKDIANFRRVCKESLWSIDSDNGSFWNVKFCQDFAKLESQSNPQDERQKLVETYKQRWEFLRRYVNMKNEPKYQIVRGHTAMEQGIVSILKDLINESFMGIQPGIGSGCPNMLRLNDFIMASKLLLGGRRPAIPKPDEIPSYEEAFAAVRIMLAQFLWNEVPQSGAWYAFDDAQKAVYSSSTDAPIYIGVEKDKVDLNWVFQCLNFFRYYMSDPHTSRLHRSVYSLDKSEQPSAWDGPLKSSIYALGKHWLGTYAVIQFDQLMTFRRSIRADDDYPTFMDALYVEEGHLQSMTLDFPKDANELTWPTLFEDHLHSLREGDQTKAGTQHSKESSPTGTESLRFNGKISDGSPFHASGWLNPLPPQAGIPGWQRITFMKHSGDNLDNLTSDDIVAYEGVVLPGGKIILGRWWFVEEGQTNPDREHGGPFIFWNTKLDDVEGENFGDE